jgi:hypothetical protein
MPKFFNIAGPCIPGEHYLVPALARAPELSGLIGKKQYFVIHAARQSGKTTLLKTLARDLTNKGTHVALYCFRGQRSEVRGQRSEVRGQRSEVGGRRSEVGGRGSGVGVGGNRCRSAGGAGGPCAGPTWAGNDQSRRKNRRVTQFRAGRRAVANGSLRTGPRIR